MANPIVEGNDTKYISILSMNGTAYTIKDAWARAEISEIEQAISGGVHFRGVSTTAIADGDNVKDLTVDGETYAASAQADGDLFIYNNGTKNLEFIVSGGKYSELGSTGELGALAFADTASGSATVDVAGAITFNTFTPNVGNGTLAVTTTAGTSLGITTTASAATAEAKFSPAAITVAEKACSVTTTATAASASVKFSPADITVAAKTCEVTTATDTFAALSSVTYSEATATLSISSVTSAAFVTGITVTAPSQTISQDADQTATVAVTYDKVSAVTAPSQTVSQDADQTVTVAVTYDKATGTTGSYLTDASLTGAILVTGAAPTATITNPTITVTVSPNSTL